MPFDEQVGNSGFIEDGTYIAKLIRFEDAPAQDFGPGMKWVFWLWEEATKTPIVDGNQEMYEFFQFSSASLAPKSKARPWMEALVGRALVEGESSAALAAEATGKSARAVLENVLKDGQYRTKILSMKPYTAKAGGKGKAQPEPELVAAAPAAAPVQQLTDDEGKLPWEA